MTILRLHWDANVPSNLRCRCGHPYERHFEVDFVEEVGLVGTAQPCKWCDGGDNGDDFCEEFRPESPYVRIAQLRDEILHLQEKLQRAEHELSRLESGES